MPRPQFTLRAMLVAMLVVGAFLGGIHRGIHIGRQRLKADDEAVALAAEQTKLLARVAASSNALLSGGVLQHLWRMQELSEEATE